MNKGNWKRLTALALLLLPACAGGESLSLEEISAAADAAPVMTVPAMCAWFSTEKSS